MRRRYRVLAATVAAVVLLTAVTVSVVLAHGGLGRGGGTAGLASVIDEQTGLSQEDLRTRLEGGESLADVIEAEGGDLEAVVTAALAGLDDKVETLVAAGLSPTKRTTIRRPPSSECATGWTERTTGSAARGAAAWAVRDMV